MGVYIKNTTKEELIEWVKLVWPHGDYDEHTFDNVINIEVPHGRLIDETRINDATVWRGGYDNRICGHIFETDAPTIIEAEE